MQLTRCALLLAWTSFFSAVFEIKAAQRVPNLCENETRRRRTSGESSGDALLEIQAWFDTTKRFAVIRVTVCGRAEPFCFVSSITGVVQDNFIDDEMLRKKLLSTFQGDGKIEPLDQYPQHGEQTNQKRKQRILTALRENVSSGSHVIYKLCKKAQVYLFISNKETTKPTVKPTKNRQKGKKGGKVRVDKSKGTKPGEEQKTDNSLHDFVSKCFRQRNESCTRICVGQNTTTGKDTMKCRKFRIQCLFQCRIPLSPELQDLTSSNSTNTDQGNDEK